MCATSHIIIIGSGLIGLSTADALMRRGARVTVLEAKDAPLQGASFANSGMIHPSQACQWAGAANDPAVDAAVLDLARDSRERLAERMATLGLTDMLARAVGCFQLFETDTEAMAAYQRLSARGIAVEAVGETVIPTPLPALFFPEDRSADAHAYGLALANDLRAKGVDMVYNAQPRLSSVFDGGYRLTCDGEPIEGDAVVLACGAHTDHLLASFNITLGLQPVRGWAIDVDRSDRLDLPQAPIMDAKTRSALTIFEDRIRLSGTWGEETPDLLRSRWRSLLPDLFNDDLSERIVWSGLRPVSPLGRPFIGETSLKGLWVNAGHGHMGWTLSAGSGALMADMMLEGRIDPRFGVLGSEPGEGAPQLALRT